ncbi:MAG: DUF642 domain-containing protein [Verrucomicrobiales bacterium]|nr:DUF642 domain-containing protein [Verrucomicrobiales bacterium]
MLKTRNLPRTAAWLALLTGGVSPAVLGQGLAIVRNPSFESNLNPAWPYYSQIDEWNSSGGGVNDLVNDPGGPFHNSGTPVPDGRRIGFKQGGGTVSQQVYGFEMGQRYWIQFHYDARNGSDLDLGIRFSTLSFGGALDEQLDFIPKIRPASASSAPYYTRTVPFTPDAYGGDLTFEVTARGDSTILLDAVTIVQRDEGNFPVINPSFEASGVVFDGAPTAGTDWPAIAGWAKEGVAGVDDGTGGQANNGTTPDQALVAFIQDEGSLTQNLAPLVPGTQYTVSFAYNARTGTTPHLQLKIDDAVLWERNVSAVGGAAAYQTATVSFTAAGTSAQLAFANTMASSSVLLDDVRVLGEVGTYLPPLETSPTGIVLRVGEEATANITLPAERLALGPATIKLQSGNAQVWELPDAGADGVLTLEFDGETTRSYTIRGVDVGSADVAIVDSAGLQLTENLTKVAVAGTTFVLNPSFEMNPDSGVGTAPVAGWTTSGGNIGMAEDGNAFLSAEDFTIPDRKRVLRIQNGGSVSQMIEGLEPWRLYGLQFFYNGRNSGYPYDMSLQVKFAGQEIASYPGIVPANQAGLTEYYFKEVRFTPTTSSGLLEFNVTVASGDASLFLDAVSIIPRLADELTIVNSSFEGTAMGANWPGYLGKIAGWEVTGGNLGVNAYSPTTFWVEPFFDNGINSDQDSVFFGQGAVTLKQNLVGMEPFQPYTLVLDYNFRDGRTQDNSDTPNSGEIQIIAGATTIFQNAALPPVDTVSPWPGFRHTRPFYQAYASLSPLSANPVELSINHIGITGDETLLIDNVRIVPGNRTPPSITTDLFDQTVQAGNPVHFTVTASGSLLTYRWLHNGIPLADGNGITGTTMATLNIAAAGTADAGDYTVIVSDGLGVVGSAALLTVEGGSGGDVSLAITRSGDGNIRIAWPADATGYLLQSASAVAGPYANDTAPVVVEGEENVVLVTPAGDAKFYRLMQ